VVDVIQSSHTDDILLALYDTDYDVEKAIVLLLDDTRDEATSDWHTVRNRKKPVSQSSQGNTPASATHVASAGHGTDLKPSRPKNRQRHEKTIQKENSHKDHGDVNLNGNKNAAVAQVEPIKDEIKFKKNDKDIKNPRKDFRIFSNRRRGFKKGLLTLS
jgi:hypothetical protein